MNKSQSYLVILPTKKDYGKVITMSVSGPPPDNNTSKLSRVMFIYRYK